MTWTQETIIQSHRNPALLWRRQVHFFLIFCYQHIAHVDIFSLKIPQMLSFYLLDAYTLLQNLQQDFKVYNCLLWEREIPCRFWNLDTKSCFSQQITVRRTEDGRSSSSTRYYFILAWPLEGQWTCQRQAECQAETWAAVPHRLTCRWRWFLPTCSVFSTYQLWAALWGTVFL